MKKNHILYYVQMALYNFIYSVAGGAMFQTFMLECGVSEARASLCASIFQVVQMATMLLLSRALEKVKKILLGIAIYMASYLLIFGAMLFLCFDTGMPIDMKFTVLLVFGLVFSMSHGCYSIISYKQPYHIMELKDYGRVSGQGGAIAGVFGIIVTSVITVALEKYEYFSTMTVLLLVCVIFALTSSAISFMFTQMDAGLKEAEKKKINIFKYKPFYLLMLPNFSRGVSTGVINLMVVIGYYDNTLDSASAALLVTVTQAATLVGCQAYSIIARKKSSGILCLIFSIGLVIFMPLMTVGGTSVTFIAFYSAVVLFNTYISYAVPVIVANNIPYSCLGQYTAWRMGLMTLGVSVGSLLVPVLLDAAGTTVTLLVGGLAMFPCGLGYFLFERSRKNKNGDIK